jgi:UDP-N-acetylmuramyl pentapeptide phosphotransferase/UDP-N-acetylglucosamine-1-phosphate transferase
VEVILTVLVAMAATSTLIVFLRPFLQRYALAMPNARSSHRQPTAQGGGLAVIIPVVVLSALLTLHSGAEGCVETAAQLNVLGATLLIMVVGAVDDIRGVPVGPRLLFQSAAAIIVIVSLPELRLVAALPWWTERLVLLIGLVWFINLVNFMDGIDWITVSEVVPVTAGLVVMGSLGALPYQGTIVALALLGAILGFAPFNKPVANLFLGDVGSLPIGLLLGWLLVLLAANGHLAAALLLPLYYVADATVTLFRRAIAGDRVWQAHRTHFYQRAADLGFTIYGINARIFSVNIVLVLLAAATILIQNPLIDIASLLLGGGMVGWLLFRFVRGKGRCTATIGGQE